jgi:hypothetical protein
VILAESDIVAPIDPGTEAMGVFTHAFSFRAASLPSLAIEIGMPDASGVVRLRRRRRAR